MIAISFIIQNLNEEKATKLLQQVADQVIEHINKFIPKPIITGTPWIYRRESAKQGEPPIDLIARNLEHYIWAGATAIDTPPHTIWSFDLQSSNHVIAVSDIDHPKFHTIKPDQVSTLFQTLAQKLSTIVKVEVSYNDDHTRTGIIYQHGNATKEDHW